MSVFLHIVPVFVSYLDCTCPPHPQLELEQMEGHAVLARPGAGVGGGAPLDTEPGRCEGQGVSRRTHLSPSCPWSWLSRRHNLVHSPKEIFSSERR